MEIEMCFWRVGFHDTGSDQSQGVIIITVASSQCLSYSRLDIGENPIIRISALRAWFSCTLIKAQKSGTTWLEHWVCQAATFAVDKAKVMTLTKVKYTMYLSFEFTAQLCLCGMPLSLISWLKPCVHILSVSSFSSTRVSVSELYSVVVVNITVIVFFLSDTGADAILMHSKRNDPKEIEEFMKAWNNQVRQGELDQTVVCSDLMYQSQRKPGHKVCVRWKALELLGRKELLLIVCRHAVKGVKLPFLTIW